MGGFLTLKRAGGASTISVPEVNVSQVARDPWLLLAFGLGSGCIRKAPGTFGTLVAVVLYWPLSHLDWLVYGAVCGAAFAAGCWLCGYAARRLGVHDHPGIVFDEFVGFWLTMLGAPAGWHWVIIGFILFRLFDIAKPWPIRWLDRNVEGGVGIMLDDVLAGVFAAICLQLLHLASGQFA